jgi:hypothetical protein
LEGPEADYDAVLIDPNSFGATILQHFEVDDSPYGVAPVFLAGVNEVVPPYTAKVYGELIGTGDTEALLLAADGIPKALKRAIEVKREGKFGLPDEQMDRMREMWGGLFACEEEVSDLARQQFELATPRLLQEDTVTYEWVGGMACRYLR